MSTTTAAISVSPDDAPEDDVAALVARVADLERAQRDEDVEAFVSLFSPSAVWVTGGGRRLVGRDAIAAFTRQVLPGSMTSATATYEVEHIAFIRPDIALTGVRQQYVDHNGPVEEQPSRGSPTYIWSEAGGAWLIVAGQNTLVSTG